MATTLSGGTTPKPGSGSAWSAAWSATPFGTGAPARLTACPAPAKLNLFLHITGRRPDGYHLLQTVFQLLDHGDLLDFTVRDDGAIRRASVLSDVAEESDLTVRAARLLQAAVYSKTGHLPPGADIKIDKRLPMGGGLGGGSSDAATTLMALNYLWRAGLSRAELMALGVQLGADVPFFLFGSNAFAEGIGEALRAVDTPACWYVVIEPGVVVPTKRIFGATHLTRNSKPVKIADFSRAPDGFGKNDLQDTASALYAPVAEAIALLGKFGNARMTGSGACVFCAFATEDLAEAALAATRREMEGTMPAQSRAWKAAALQQHPLAALR